MTSRVMQDFDLLLPESVADAVALLDTHKENSTILAGGTDLLIALKFDYAVDNVISLVLVPGLDGLSYSATDGLTIGAKVTITDIVKSPEVRENYPALWQSAEIFATPQLRNTATVVGNILRGSPAGDGSLACLALGGSIILENKAGRREVSLDDFWTSYGKTARANDELAIAVKIPAPVSGQKSAFQRMTRVTEDLAKLSASVCLQMDGDICREARVCMGCVGPTLIRLPEVEKILEGAEITDNLLQEISAKVASEISPIDDIRSSADYRRRVAGVLVKRVINLALNEGKDQ